ncbi:MAG TPA: type IX secretion system membrane protein PorP/SprF [Bacteroides sp.]|nr:type IX secretion system membrane protein PorP/SprF [Bacteroides sp.]
MKKTLIIALLSAFFCIPEVRAQQLPLYSQYILNGFMVNPAMAGYDGFTSFNTTARQQWLGFKDAPATYSGSWQTRVLKQSYKIVNHPIRRDKMLIPSTKGRVGLGAYIINDSNAKLARTGISFTYAYHIFMKNTQLSFGLAARLFQYRLYSETLTFGESGDPVLSSGFNSVAYSPDADFGVFYRGFGYFAGFSVSNLLQTAILIGAHELPEFKTYRHYWLMGGYSIPLSSEFELEPGFLLKTSENWNPQGDFSLKLYYEDQFWGGFSYRTNKSLIALVGIRIEGLYIGYSFDWALSEIGHFNYGSHELNLCVKLGSDARRYKWLNRY